MAANIESMFYTREKPWHGLGTRVEEAPASADALRLAGLDWQVVQEPIFTDLGEMITGYKANVRDSDRKVLGVVSDRYRIVQNQEAFSFTDSLLGSGVRYESKVMKLEEFVKMNLAQKKKCGVVVQELVLSKLAVMTFSV